MNSLKMRDLFYGSALVFGISYLFDLLPVEPKLSVCTQLEKTLWVIIDDVTQRSYGKRENLPVFLDTCTLS